MRQFRKRMLVNSLLVALVASSLSTTNISAIEKKGVDFSDVNGHWAEKYIKDFADKGYIQGYGDGTFRPGNNVTRAEFIKIVNRAFGFTQKGSENFSDVNEDDWYYNEVLKAEKQGYIQGYGDGTFRPNDKITREEACKIIAMILNANGDGITKFKDDEEISNWARKYVDGLVDMGIIHGYEDNTFRPKNNATRAESVKTLHGAKDRYNPGSEEPPVISPIPPTQNDLVSPTLIVQSHSPNSSTRDNIVNISGIASDNKEIASIEYKTNFGISGVATGTENWTIKDLHLEPGENTITITATDTSNNKTEVVLKVEYDLGKAKKIEESDIVKDTETGLNVVKNQILITFKQHISENEAKDIINNINGKIVGHIYALNDYQVEIEGKSIDELNDIIKDLNQNEKIDIASLNNVVNTDATPNDPWAGDNIKWDESKPNESNWGLEAIKMLSVWDNYDIQSPIEVGIVDSGFDINHTDLKMNRNNAYGADGKYITNDLDKYGNPVADHGTHVAGTIGALSNNNEGITGILSENEINVYRTNFTDFDIKLATLWNLEKGSKVINYSLGISDSLADAGCSTEEMEAIKESEDKYWSKFVKLLVDKGYDFLLVQSAGNQGDNGIAAKYNGLFAAIEDQALKERIIVVGSIDNKGEGIFGHKGYELSDFSCYGDRVDVVAPGGNIYSTVNSGYKSKNGTSMAAPHVTGVAAYIWSLRPDLSAKEIRNIIVNDEVSQNTQIEYAESNGVRYDILNAKSAAEVATNRSEGGGEDNTPESPSSIVTGSVKNAITSAGIRDAQLKIINMNSDSEVYTYKTELDGSYQFTLKESGRYIIEVSHDDYITEKQIVDIEVGTNVYPYNMMLVSKENDTIGSVEGRIDNAVTGTGVENAQISFRRGINFKEGDIVGEIVNTNEDGEYSVELPAGNYTAEVKCEGYIKGYFNVISMGEVGNTNQNGTISPILDDNQYRIVLRWEEEPMDLDSHITGPTSNADDRFHVYYADREYYGGSEELLVNLDRDDVDSYGPETTTIYVPMEGTYRFSVHDYTNRDEIDSDKLSNSGAYVQVFKGSSLIETFNVPPFKLGNLWTVFEIENNEIKPIDEISNHSDPDSVRSENKFIYDKNIISNLPSKN